MRKPTILIVEDAPYTALDLADAIEDVGGEVVGPVATVTEAMKLIDRGGIEGAVLDANLLDRDITPVVERLLKQAVPFVIHTGTGLPIELAAMHPMLTLIMKPARARDVVSKLLTEMRLGSTAAIDA